MKRANPADMDPEERNDLRSILAFYSEAGVDAVLADEPINRLAETPPGVAAVSMGAEAADPSGETPVSGSRPRPPLQRVGGSLSLNSGAGRSPDAPPAPDVAIMAAREAATTTTRLEDLRAVVESFEGCALRATAKRLVFADGNPLARVMFVGEAPGREEDIEGLPFVGRSGQLLDRMMAAIGLDRTSAYIANVVPWRPPGNRTPTPQETQICLPFIRRQIELADPDILVCLGSPSAQALLGLKDGIRKSRGRWQAYHTGTREIRAIASFHPAYLLRTPLEKRFAWRDFLAIRQALGDQPGPRAPR